MVEFKQEWAFGMDGGEKYIKRQGQHNNLKHNPEVSQVIDYALAAACEHANNPEQVCAYLDNIIADIIKTRNNIKKDTK